MTASPVSARDERGATEVTLAADGGKRKEAARSRSQFSQRAASPGNRGREAGSLPVFQRQARNSAELGRVVGHQRHLIGQGDCRYHQIVWPDWRAQARQVRPNLAVLLGGSVV